MFWQCMMKGLKQNNFRRAICRIYNPKKETLCGKLRQTCLIMDAAFSWMSATSNFKIFSWIYSHKSLIGLEAIWRDGEVVGFIRRGEYSFALGKSLAYGYVKNPSGKPVTTEFLKSGKYTIESMGELFPAQVHTKAPFDPKNLRVQGIYENL